LRIFLASVLDHFAPLRDAATRGIACLGHEVIQSEGLSPLIPDTTRQTCIDEARTSDAMVVLLGSHYGLVQQDGLSATHEEYRAARERCPVFVFVEEGAQMDPYQAEFLREIEAWELGQPIVPFRDAVELRDRVTCTLHHWQTGQAAGEIDIDKLRARAARLIPEQEVDWRTGISIVIVGGPWQQVLRPGACNDPRFRRDLQRDVMYGPHLILDPGGEPSTKVHDGLLTLEQAHASLLVAPDGSIRVRFIPKQKRSSAAVLSHEYIRERIASTVGFVAAYWDRIDSKHKLTDALPIVVGSGTEDWTRLQLDPPTVKRDVLGESAHQLAADFTALLRERAKAVS
jgi:hypothetical protein